MDHGSKSEVHSRDAGRDCATLDAYDSSFSRVWCLNESTSNSLHGERQLFGSSRQVIIRRFKWIHL
jgi:hypothetical protein